MTEILLINSKQPHQTQTINLEPKKMFNGECLIGRDKRCCLVLNDPLVSRIHGKIVYKDGNEQEPECEHGHILTCIAKPVGRVVLEA